MVHTVEKILIKFDKHAAPYAKDEIAGFIAERAARYVKNKLAHYCDAAGNDSKKPVAVRVAMASLRTALEQ